LSKILIWTEPIYICDCSHYSWRANASTCTVCC